MAFLSEPSILQVRKLRLILIQGVVSLCQPMDPGLSNPHTWVLHHHPAPSLQCGWLGESGNLSPKSEHPEIQLCDHRDFVGFDSPSRPHYVLPHPGKGPNQVLEKSISLMPLTAAWTFSFTVSPNFLSSSGMLESAWAGAGPAKRGRSATTSVLGASKDGKGDPKM